MSELAAPPPATSISGLGHFTSRRLMSLFGILPLGTFVAYHFYFHSFSHQGEAVYDRRLAELYAQPFHLIVSVLTVYAPLLWHSIVGLTITRRSRPNFLQYTFFRNHMYTLQRVSGIGLLLFLPAHLVKARFSNFFLHETMSYAHEAEGFTHLLSIAVYVLGILGVSFHLGNGLWNFLVDWGVLVGQKAQRSGTVLAILVFLGLSAMGFWAMAGFMK